MVKGVGRAAVAAIFLVSLVAAQERPTIDKWLEGGYRMPRPQVEWSQTGELLVWQDGVLQISDPVSGDSRAAFDGAKALEGLNKLLPEPRTRLPRASEVDSANRRALYSQNGELLLLEFSTNEFAKIATEKSAKSASFSPDGLHVAYVMANDLYAYSVADKKSTRLTTTGTATMLNGTLNWVYWEEIFGRRDIGYWWSPDSKAIAFLETDESPVSLSYYVDHRERDDRLIEQRYPKAGSNNPKVRTGVVEIANPKTAWVGPDAQTYEYVTRVKWLPNSQEVAIQTLNRPQTDLTLTFAPRAGGPGRTVLVEHDDAYVNMSDDLAFLKGGEEFIWPSEKTGYYHLYRYKSDGTLLNPITQGEWQLVSNPGLAFWVRGALCGVDEAGGWVYFTTNKDDSLQRQMYRAKLDGSGLAPVTTEPGTHGIRMAPGATRYLDNHSSFVSPPVLTLRDGDGKLIRQIGETPKPVKVSASDHRVLKIPARDGFPMPATLLMPARFDASKKYPLVIYCYGGPSAPSVINEYEGIGWSHILAEHGFAVLVFDNRTATSISKKLEVLPFKEYMSTVELNDLVDAARWAKAQPFVDPARVGVWGWSNGGTYVLLGMTRSTEFKAGIAVAAVSDGSIYDSKWTEGMMKTPQTNPEGFAATDLTKRAAGLSGKLLMVHGTYDDNVHPQQFWRMVDALVEARKPFEMMVYPMRMHGISDDAAQRHLYKAMLEFWKRNL